MLLGVPEVELDLEAQAVELDDFFIVLLQVSAEQNHMRLSVCQQVGF